MALRWEYKNNFLHQLNTSSSCVQVTKTVPHDQWSTNSMCSLTSELLAHSMFKSESKQVQKMFLHPVRFLKVCWQGWQDDCVKWKKFKHTINTTERLTSLKKTDQCLLKYKSMSSKQDPSKSRKQIRGVRVQEWSEWEGESMSEANPAYPRPHSVSSH